MRRFCLLLLLASLPACRIEQTPQRFIDHQQTPAEELAASEAELRSRLNAMHASLQRRNPADVAGALMPHPNVVVIGPFGGEMLTRPEEISTALARLAEGSPGAGSHLSVSVGPRNNIAWFQTEGAAGRDPSASPFRFSGVFLRQNGEWRLISGHLSRPYPEPARDAPGD